MNTKDTHARQLSTMIRTVVLAAPIAAVALSIGAGTAAAAAPGVPTSTETSSPCPPPPPPPPPAPELPLAAPEGEEDPVPVPVPATTDDAIDDELRQPTDEDCPEPDPDPDPCEETSLSASDSLVAPDVEPEEVPEEEIDDFKNPEAVDEPEDCDETPVPTRIDAGYAGDAQAEYGVLLAGSAVLAAAGSALSMRGRVRRQD